VMIALLAITQKFGGVVVLTVLLVNTVNLLRENTNQFVHNVILALLQILLEVQFVLTALQVNFQMVQGPLNVPIVILEHIVTHPRAQNAHFVHSKLLLDTGMQLVYFAPSENTGCKIYIFLYAVRTSYV